MDALQATAGTAAVPEQVVDFLYRHLLGRGPDAGGFAFYVDALKAGHVTVAELHAFLSASDEHRWRQGGHNVFEDLIRIPYLGCEFMISKWSIVAQELQLPQGYEPWVLPQFLDACREGMRVLDIGASWGVYALPAARRIGPGGRLFAVEVSPQNGRLLLQNAEMNGLTNFELLAFGASDRVGVARLSIQTFTNTNSIDQITPGVGAADPAFAEFTAAPTLPLDLLRGHLGRIDLVKMDIDGFEYRACMGARELIAQHRPTVFLEYCPHLLRLLSGVEPMELLRPFLDWNYAVDVLHRDRPRERMTGSMDEVMTRVAAICAEHVAKDGGSHLDLCMTPDARAPCA